MNKIGQVAASCLTLGLLGSQAGAVTTSITNDAAALVGAAIAANSGITVVSGSQSLLGGQTQQGTYSGFSQGPGTADQPTLTIADGVYLTSGGGNFSTTTNTVNNFSVDSGTGSYAPLVTLASQKGLSTSQYNANVLSFTFTVDDPTQNAILGSFLFATDEWPTQSVTDILGIFVNGVNYAFFPDGSLVSNQPGNTTFFNANPVGSTDYGIEYNGLTSVYNFAALVKPGENNFALAISDTSDDIFDSAVFLTGLKAGTTTGGGGIDPGNPSAVPVPASAPLLMGALGFLAFMRKRMAKA